MIPIKNKKKTLEMTVEEMRNFSFSYIEKYSPSKQQLKTYLMKKYAMISRMSMFMNVHQRKNFCYNGKTLFFIIILTY